MESSQSKTRNGTKGPKSYKEKAQTFIIKMSKEESFPKEIESIKKTGSVKAKSIIAAKVRYLDDNGIMRSKSRLAELEIDQLADETMVPILLDGNTLLR